MGYVSKLLIEFYNKFYFGFRVNGVDSKLINIFLYFYNKNFI